MSPSLWKVGCAFDPWLSHTKDFKTGSSCPFTLCSALYTGWPLVRKKSVKFYFSSRSVNYVLICMHIFFFINSIVNICMNYSYLAEDETALKLVGKYIWKGQRSGPNKIRIWNLSKTTSLSVVMNNAVNKEADIWSWGYNILWATDTLHSIKGICHKK